MLNHLGTAAWAKTKARVRKAMKDMTEELLKLYAQRKTAQGHSFPADNEWMREFEDAFEYSETEDQDLAINDVKRDMESSLPMDRLLCGDVGYGKTEIAMRAAFKAISDNKQVAVLAPTTVLAFQHFETFKQRFAAFPVTIDMVSRFRSPKQQKEILQRVEAGKVDILIGTHRLLSKDVKFADLGLLVVDEEQRFGVRHKERLKQMRKEVDVLSMSATPIPRTLHMSLVGLRDMSVIETPPRDRIAIQTVVASWDEKLIQTAIEQELERGGQVYFVHNRVESIWDIAAKLQALVPRARVAVGGQGHAARPGRRTLQSQDRRGAPSGVWHEETVAICGDLWPSTTVPGVPTWPKMTHVPRSRVCRSDPVCSLTPRGPARPADGVEARRRLCIGQSLRDWDADRGGWPRPGLPGQWRPAPARSPFSTCSWREVFFTIGS